MKQLLRRTLLRQTVVAGGLLLGCGVVTYTAAQSGNAALPAGAEWRSYAADSFSTKYSPLDQINAGNVSKLRVAWRWKSNNFGPRNEGNMETTPLMIGGRLYFTAGQRLVVIAADAETGETLWMYRLEEGDRASLFPRPYNRGVAYWKDSNGEERIYAVTAGYNLVALDAKTGVPVPSFGAKGIVDLFDGLERAKPGEIGATSPPIVVKDVIIVGAALKNGTSPVSKTNVPADIRGYDVRTGKRLWTFHTIPRAGEFGNETWKDGSWEYTGNTSVWAPMSADEELGYVYLPVESPTGDFYGGERPGDALGDQDSAVRWRGSGLLNGAPNGGGPAFRAIDKKTGKILHELKLNGVTSGTPMTYLWKGKQYIVIATTNRTEGAELVALTLGN
jgi:quinoprotein glucose dehydrogenase